MTARSIYHKIHLNYTCYCLTSSWSNILLNFIHKRASPETARTSKAMLEEGSTDDTLSYCNSEEQSLCPG